MTAKQTIVPSTSKQALDEVLAYALNEPNLAQASKETIAQYVKNEALLINAVGVIDRVLHVSARFTLYGTQVFIRKLALDVYGNWARAHPERLVEYVFLSGRIKQWLSLKCKGAQHSGSVIKNDADRPNSGSSDNNQIMTDGSVISDGPSNKEEQNQMPNGSAIAGQTFVLVAASFTALSEFYREKQMCWIADVYEMVPDYVLHHHGNILELASVGAFLTLTGALAWQNPSVRIWPVLRSVVCSLASTKHNALVACKDQPAILVVLKKLFRLCWEGESQADKQEIRVRGDRLCHQVVNLILNLAATRATLEMPSVLLVPVIDTIPISEWLSLTLSQTLCDLPDPDVINLLQCLEFWCDNWKVPSNVVLWLLEVLEVLIESGRAILLSKPPIVGMIKKYVNNPSTSERATRICDTLIKLEINKLLHETYAEAGMCRGDDVVTPTMATCGTHDSLFATRQAVQPTSKLLELCRSPRRLGLLNPGLYCYMNSVLQMLYAATRFRYDVLHASDSMTGGSVASDQRLLRQLQQVFAFMEHSTKSVYDPVDFRHAALPVHFNAMHQHDCWEFLGHLLDELHEQERTHWSRSLLPLKHGPSTRSDSNCTALAPENSRPIEDYDSKCIRGRLNACPMQPSCLSEGEKHTGDGKTATEVVVPLAEMETGPSCDSPAAVELSNDPRTLPVASQGEEPTGVAGNKTISWKHFGGCQLVTTRCQSCGTASRKLEPFLHIPVHVPKEEPIADAERTAGARLFDDLARLPPPPTVASLIERALGDERLEGDNQPLCDRCGCNRDAVRASPVCTAPPYLIVTLCRFGFDRSTGARTKTRTPVRSDERLFLPVMPLVAAEESPPASSYTDGAVPAALDIIGGGVTPSSCGATATVAEYRLLAAVSHLGTDLSAGHYVCHARHELSMLDESSSEAEQQQWFLFDDDKVRHSSYGSIPGNTRSPSSETEGAATAYVLLYERVLSEPLSSVDSGSTTVSSGVSSTTPTGSRSGIPNAGRLPLSLAAVVWHDNIANFQNNSKLLVSNTTYAVGNSVCRPFTERQSDNGDDDDDDSFIRQAGKWLDDSVLTGSRFIH